MLFGLNSDSPLLFCDFTELPDGDMAKTGLELLNAKCADNSYVVCKEWTQCSGHYSCFFTDNT